MLMDEPFGAIDPITRSRLQDEFLRLQTEIRKTVLFVTHDIDEAIKMGDRIAVLRHGGELAQFATPADLLMHPADEFVEQFVGSDRALKRLALTRVRELDLRVLMPDQERNGLPRISQDVPLRDALAQLLEAGHQEGIVVDTGGTAQGVITIDLISRSLELPA
jgi:osmoprotectant transport system ATP-binding protein